MNKAPQLRCGGYFDFKIFRLMALEVSDVACTARRLSSPAAVEIKAEGGRNEDFVLAGCKLEDLAWVPKHRLRRCSAVLCVCRPQEPGPVHTFCVSTVIDNRYQAQGEGAAEGLKKERVLKNRRGFQKPFSDLKS